MWLHHKLDEAQFEVLLRKFTRKLDFIMKNQEKLMATIQELEAAVARNTEVEDSVLVLLRGISQQFKDARAQNNPAAISAVIAQLDASTEKLSSAVVENTPVVEEVPASEPAPEPVA